MFETLDIAEINLPDIFSDQGLRTWWYVQRQLHTPWFHVTYLEKYEEGDEQLTLRSLVFFTQQQHLIQFAQSPDKIIEEIYIVTPDHINGSSHWQMELLKEIWEGSEPEHIDQISHIYRLDNGKEYVDSGLGSLAVNLLNKKCIFTCNNSEAS